jgi:hypothetical protein
MHEVAQKLVNTPLFSFQNLRLSTKDIIVILKYTLNTTLGLLPIFDSRATRAPSNTLEKHLIGSRVANDVRNLITSSSMVKLVRSPTSFLHSHIKRELRTLHLWICYSAKALWIAILSTKSLTRFQR